MCVTIHVVTYIFQGCFDCHTRMISATEKMKAFCFCIVCRFHLNRKNTSLIISDEVYFRIRLCSPKITVNSHALKLCENIVFCKRTFKVNIRGVSFKNGPIINIGLSPQEADVCHIDFEIGVVCHPGQGKLWSRYHAEFTCDT